MHRSWLFIVLVILLSIACQEEEKISTSQNLQLAFSEDTLVFDTILTSRTSITKRFRIFNNNDNAVVLNRVAVAGGDASPFELIVNGKTGQSISNESLLAGDSLLVLVKATLDPTSENLPFLVKDSVLVEWNGNQEDVKLVAWGQNANYLQESIICDEVWTAEKPYVLTEDILVDSLCQLRIEEGTKIFIDQGVRIFVQGQLTVLGDSGNWVVFRNSRFDEGFIEAPGQWDGIYFLEGSTGEINYSIIENGRVGLRSGTPDTDTIPDLIVRNSIVRHMSETAVQAFTSDLYFENCLMYNAGQSLVFHAAGGNYYYDHCTLVNTPNFFFSDVNSFVFADNLILSNEETIVNDLQVRIRNSILWDEGEDEVIFSVTTSSGSSVELSQNILFGTTQYDFNLVSREQNFPGFADPVIFDYTLDSLSVAIDQAIPGISDFDLEGRARDNFPDIGAYERIP